MRETQWTKRLLHVMWVAFVVALLAQPGHAGQEDPDITDPAEDQGVIADLPDPLGHFAAADILAVWIGNETADNITVYVQAGGDISGGAIGPVDTETYQYLVHGTIGETGYLLIATVDSTDGTAKATLGASQVTIAGDTLAMLVPKSELGNPGAGDILTGFYAETSVKMQNTGPVLAKDRAPDADYGRDYVFGPNVPVDPLDTDADDLLDAWEQEHFGGLDQNAASDPDGDGCNNACELAAGTDPNNADSDGDGINDGDELSAGSNPLDANDPPQEPNPADEPRDEPTDDGATGDDAPVEDPVDAAPVASGSSDEASMLDTLSDNADYLGLTGGLLAGVLILSMIGLAGRWPL